ncbi:hypothetical protein [Virgibacillus pantothenticus]|uniref:hypothetical protein n=1 Tax=Virgibacillus pantothenticus TaxID=1473 RepID=UPI0025AFC09A|nr:hypothetical protein [Virgibacillus pantothenticus]
MSGLSNREKNKVKKAVITELEKYRYLKWLQEPTQEHKEFFQTIDNAVEGLPEKESFLIRKRYLSNESEYITDSQMYNEIFDPPVSERTYSSKIRDRAMLKLALSLWGGNFIDDIISKTNQ